MKNMVKHIKRPWYGSHDKSRNPPDEGLRIATNGYDYVIAENLEHARRIAIEAGGFSAPEGDLSDPNIEFDDIDGDGWVAYHDDEEFSIVDNNTVLMDAETARKLGFPVKARISIRASSKEWVEARGAGYLGCSEA